MIQLLVEDEKKHHASLQLFLRESQVLAAGAIRVYGHPDTFIQRFIKRKGKRIGDIGVPGGQGIAEIEKAEGEVVLSTRPAEVVPGLWTTGQIERKRSRL